MKDLRMVMGMPVSVEIADTGASEKDVDDIFAYFAHVEATFSPYKAESETSLINAGLLRPEAYSEDMRTILRLAEKARLETDGYFDVRRDDRFNPVGLVKGWAIHNVAGLLRDRGLWDFYIEAGGDIQVSGLNQAGVYWIIGIRNPFRPQEVVKVLHLSDIGIATSGTYARGDHIYDPHRCGGAVSDDIVSLTVIGPNVYEADVLATAAFAMGRAGISFVEELPGFEGYLIDMNGTGTMTSGFAAHTVPRPCSHIKESRR